MRRDRDPCSHGILPHAAASAAGRRRTAVGARPSLRGRARQRHRPERRRQDDAVQPDHRPRRARRRAGPLRRQRRSPGCRRSGWRPLGIARTFQHGRVFANLSVLDNVLVGAHTRLQAVRPAVAGDRAAGRTRAGTGPPAFGQGRGGGAARGGAGDPGAASATGCCRA